MEDALILRSSRVIQKRSPMTVATVEDQLPVAAVVTEQIEGIMLNDEDVAKLQKIFMRVEELEKLTSFNSSWRQEAEADYVATRNRLLESESVCSSAVALANEAGQLSTSIGSRLAWLEMDISSKGNQIGDHAAQLNALNMTSNSIQQALDGLIKQTAKIEELNIANELNILQHQFTELDGRISKAKTKRQNLEKNYTVFSKDELERFKSLEERVIDMENNAKNADKLIVLLQTEVSRLKEKENDNNDIIKKLQEDLAEERFMRIKFMQDDASDLSILGKEEAPEFVPNSTATLKWTDVVKGSDYHSPKEDICRVAADNGTTFGGAHLDPGVKRPEQNETVLRKPTKDVKRTGLGIGTVAGGGTQHSVPIATRAADSVVFDPPKGPKKWINRMTRQRKDQPEVVNTHQPYRRCHNDTCGQREERSKASKVKARNRGIKISTQSAERLKALEAEIQRMKAKIQIHENRKSYECNRSQSINPELSKSGWQIPKKKHVYRIPQVNMNKPKFSQEIPSWETKREGRYKMMINAADDGCTMDLASFQAAIMDERNNKRLLEQLSTIGNFRYEYRNRLLLHHNHRGGLLLSVETPQEATRCQNLGIWINGKKHRVMPFVKARADDLCLHCSSWGHLERSCRYDEKGRCAICSNEHRTERHDAVSNPKGKCRIKCPNCSGYHRATDDSCKVKQAALERLNKNQIETLTSSHKEGKNTMNRGANTRLGHRRRHV